MSSSQESKPSFFSKIGTRLVLGYALVLLVSIAALSFFFYIQVKQNLTHETQTTLKKEFATTLESLQVSYFNQENMVNLLSKRTLLTHGMSPIQFALYDGEGLLLARSEDFSERLEAVQRIQADTELGAESSLRE